jgi:NADH-ubiquinone oxidoreductase chain 5
MSTFFGLLSTFAMSMAFLVEDVSRYFLILGWESIRLISYFLISIFYVRNLSQTSATLALLTNRLRDFLLFCYIFWERALFLLRAVMTKSALTFFVSWLPNAIERPTPVSSLLHSSTIVVARVFMVDFFGLLNYFFASTLVFFGAFFETLWCPFFGL